jgi:hypothetical protein
MTGRDELRLAWLAGIIDGEGCLTIFRRTYRDRRGIKQLLPAANVTITNTSVEMIGACRGILDTLGVKYTMNDPHAGSCCAKKPLVRISVRNYGSIQVLLKAILPHMVAKRFQAEQVLEFVRRAMAKGFDKESRQVFLDAVSSRNQSGAPSETARRALADGE